MEVGKILVLPQTTPLIHIMSLSDNRQNDPGSLRHTSNGGFLSWIPWPPPPPPLPYPNFFKYGLDRPIVFEKKKKFGLWPGWIINIGVLLFGCVVVLVNVITQGYQTVSTYEVYYNATLNHWYNHFPLMKIAPGSECEPHIFSVGDTFVTNIGSFTWTLSAAHSLYNGVESGSLNASKIITMGQYSGTSLDWCDVNSLHVAADYVQWKAEVSAVILCYNGDFILANTVVLAGWQDDAWFRQRTTNVNMPSTWVQAPVYWAALDLLTQMTNLAGTTTASQPIRQLAVTGLPTQCPRQYVKDPQGFNNAVSSTLLDQRPWCTQADQTAPPALGVQWTLEQVQVVPVNVSSVPAFALENAVNNTLQAMLAAVRWDLGNLLPNNFLSNTEEVLTQNETFLTPFTTFTSNSGNLFNYLATNPWNTTSSFADLQLPETPLILVDFLCSLSVFKSPFTALWSVLIGTLSVGGSGWTVILFGFTWLYTRHKDQTNWCEAHPVVPKPPRSKGRNIEGDSDEKRSGDIEASKGGEDTVIRPGVERGDTVYTAKSGSSGPLSPGGSTAPINSLSY